MHFSNSGLFPWNNFSGEIVLQLGGVLQKGSEFKIGIASVNEILDFVAIFFSSLWYRSVKFKKGDSLESGENLIFLFLKKNL